MNKYNDYKTIYKLYESEKVLLPLMIHENYKKRFQKNLYDNRYYKLLKISDSISGDNIETSIYTDQNWYLQNICFYTCVNPSYWINKKFK